MCNVYRRSKIGIFCNINRRRRCLFVFWHFSCSCGKRYALDFTGAIAFCDIFRRSRCLFLIALFLLLRKTLPFFIIHWLHVTVCCQVTHFPSSCITQVVNSMSLSRHFQSINHFDQSYYTCWARVIFSACLVPSIFGKTN